jgi:hypothetical protein
MGNAGLIRDQRYLTDPDAGMPMPKPMPSYGKDMRVHVKKEVETVCEMQQKKNICLGNNTILFLVKLKNRRWVIYAREWI